MTALFGPFGALYVSKRAGMVLIVPFVVAGLYFATRDDFEGYRALWSVAVPAAVVYAIAAVLMVNAQRT